LVTEFPQLNKTKKGKITTATITLVISDTKAGAVLGIFIWVGQSKGQANFG